MSLYTEASRLLATPGSGSLKSRIFNSTLKNSKQIYALIIESTKYDLLLSEIINHADLLAHEPKLTPTLALLLVHDFLLSKNGIAAAAQHPLRLAVERQKSRLKAEFIKSRVRRACTTVDELKTAILREKGRLNDSSDVVYPRWVRVNTIRSSLEEQFETTFAAYEIVQSLAELVLDPDDLSSSSSSSNNNRVFIDPHVPDLVAVPPGTDFSTQSAYRQGKIILQDKASCFPAYLLAGEWRVDGDMVDGCAAPGNKTTHLAALRQTAAGKVIAMDASQARSKTLAKMVNTAGADTSVTVLPGQDFLALDPTDARFANVTGLLLDPSCSGSGIIGRDDVELVLPEPRSQPNKRKRPAPTPASAPVPAVEKKEDEERLLKLSNLQTHIVEHALSFPAAKRITYSTCSVHEIENEAVVARVLNSDVARQRGWRVLRRDEQPEGLKRWGVRGQSTTGLSKSLDFDSLEGCLRCFPGDEQGVGGFFVVGFIREEDSDEEDEWNGFSDSDSDSDSNSNAA